MANVVDLLDRPTYGFGQVDRILGLKTGTAQRWIDGYDRGGRHYSPLIREQTTQRETATWGEFVEARMLAEYRDAGVPIIRMRPAIENLRAEFGRYPLASARLWLGHDGRDLVRAIQDDVGLEDELAIVVVKSNNAMFPGVGQIQWSNRARTFKDSLEWSGEGDNQVVSLVRPLANNQDVVIDPLRGFGDPVVRSVRTEVIGELFRAGDPPEMIADLYDLTVSQVNAALRYELVRQTA